MMKKTSLVKKSSVPSGYNSILTDVAHLLELARRASVRTTNAIMTATYWEIGRRIVEFEQKGRNKAGYGEELIDRLAADLMGRFGRGFGRSNLFQMRAFYLAYPGIVQTLSGQLEKDSRSKKIQTLSGKCDEIRQTLSAEFKEYTSSDSTAIIQTPSEQLSIADLANRFPLPWSHYVMLLSIKKPEARTFYEAEALRGGWSVRQLDRQISSQFYERALLSRNKAAMLKKGVKSLPADALTPEEEIKDPFVLEFLNLKDEYSENDLEEALILQLEHFLLELGSDFAFVGRQRRLRIGDEWYRVDLLFFHRKLRCLVIIDLKLGKFTHADAGQMHLYLNYAREHWTNDGENPPVGLILCAQKDHAVAHYALEGLSNKILASEYRTTLPDGKILATELERTRKEFEKRAPARLTKKYHK
jgi:predicted nuclease of restriction endonuclease-like (RecB) superfamily